MAAQRIQRRRTSGWSMPHGAVYVGRPTKWGNPFRLHDRMGGLVRYRPEAPADFEFEGRISAHGTGHDYFGPDGHVTAYRVRWATRIEIVELFRRTLVEPDRGMLAAYPSQGGHVARATPAQARADLSGRDLVCWCSLDQPCHADVLLEIANGGTAY